jgi:hypothetical protein
LNGNDDPNIMFSCLAEGDKVITEDQIKCQRRGLMRYVRGIQKVHEEVAMCE